MSPDITDELERLHAHGATASVFIEYKGALCMTVCYHNEAGETITATIPVQTCENCEGEELHYIEADFMRASIACFCCNFQKWIEFDEKRRSG